MNGENYQLNITAKATNNNASQVGDFCHKAVVFGGNGFGSYNALTLVNWHSIGESFGEDGSNMGCLFNSLTHKSTWFKFSLNNTNKSHITFSITNQTNAAVTNIRFRLLWGSCNAMTFSPCVENAFSSFKLDSMSKDDYYILAVTPIECSGSMRATATVLFSGYPICKPVSLSAPLANFSPLSICGNQTVSFQNISTAGNDITYNWDFDNSMQSATKSPTVTFLSTQNTDTFMVKLVITNSTNNERDFITLPVIIYGIPILFDAGTNQNLLQGSLFGVQLQANTNYPSAIFKWSPTDFLSNPFISNPKFTTLYKLKMRGENCELNDSVKITVYKPTTTRF